MAESLASWFEMFEKFNIDALMRTDRANYHFPTHLKAISAFFLKIARFSEENFSILIYRCYAQFILTKFCSFSTTDVKNFSISHRTWDLSLLKNWFLAGSHVCNSHCYEMRLGKVLPSVS